MQEAQTDRKILSAARQSIILADHTNFRVIGQIRLALAESVDTIIIDDQASRHFIRALREKRVQVIRV